MERKRFTGWIDGHYVSGTYTEQNDQDIKEENEVIGSVIGGGLKLVGAVLLGGLALAALAGTTKDEKK